MSPESRQTLLKLLLPAMAIGVGYQLFIVPKASRRARLAQEALTKAREQPSAQRALAEQRRRARELPAKLDELKGRKAALEEELAAALVCTDQDRGREIEAVVGLFVRRGLRLIEEGPQDGGLLPAPLRRLKTLPRVGAGAGERRLWRLDFEGRFSDALAAFDEVGAVCDHAVPVSLQVRKPGVDGVEDPLAAALSPSVDRLWTVVLWI